MSDSLSIAACLLSDRRRSGQPGSRLPPDCRPADADSALEIQEAVIARLGERIGGWKCGLPGTEQPIAAPIHAGDCHADSPVPVRGNSVQVEPELAFVLAHDLPARSDPYREAEVDAAIASIHLALERVGSRYLPAEDTTFPERLADGLSNEGLVIGPAVGMSLARRAATFPLQIAWGGKPRLALDARHPAGLPQAPLYWLVEFLRSRGRTVRAGQPIITGSYAGVVTLPVAETLTLRFGELGVLTVRFESAQ